MFVFMFNTLTEEEPFKINFLIIVVFVLWLIIFSLHFFILTVFLFFIFYLFVFVFCGWFELFFRPSYT